MTPHSGTAASSRSSDGADRSARRGTLAEWDRVDGLSRIDVPTLVIGGAHDTMDPDHLRDMAARLPQGSYLHCPEGSHLSMYDDQQTYMSGLVDWLRSQV